MPVFRAISAVFGFERRKGRLLERGLFQKSRRIERVRKGGIEVPPQGVERRLLQKYAVRLEGDARGEGQAVRLVEAGRDLFLGERSGFGRLQTGRTDEVKIELIAGDHRPVSRKKSNI